MANYFMPVRLRIKLRRPLFVTWSLGIQRLRAVSKITGKATSKMDAAKPNPRTCHKVNGNSGEPTTT